MSTLPTLFTYTAYRLANEVDCACPDALDSPGAQFLNSVQDSVNEAIENGFDLAEITDIAHGIADNAPDVYTYTLWTEFVDLCAWQEDISDYGALEDMESGARLSLYSIAYRLAAELLNQYERGLGDADEDEGDET